MGHADYYRSGTYNGICDRCGSKFKFSDLKLEWDGLYVCTANGCWEPRQPQDYVKGVMDNMAVPVSRPDQPNVFLQNIIAVVTSTVSMHLSEMEEIIGAISTSLCSIVGIIIKAPRPSTRAVNGSALNTVTLG